MILSRFLGHGTRVALDLGNNNTVLTDAKNLPFSAPSFVALNKSSKSAQAVGQDAYEMQGKIGAGVKIVKPLKGGIIADYEAASMMLGMLMRNAYPKRGLFDKFDQLICGIPYASTDVERRALRDALEQFKSRSTTLIYEPIAAAIGMGLNVQEPNGKFMVDVGGGITEIALISLSGIVTHRAVKVAGDTFDYEIQDYFKRKFNVAIGLKQAEQLKIKTGAAFTSIVEVPEPACVAGKDISTGVPKLIEVGPMEIANILNDSVIKIEDAILQTLEECPPELSGDIYTNGIYLTGGSSLLRGLRERLAARINIPIHQDPNALFSVLNGIAGVLRVPQAHKAVLFK
ncbi:rod shape-determining protein [Cesiribacter sp. SM1]|uniref:rod shape-determining protein n=1 Tax=Cesiribacter sp. SM1 TaxID=2861196 RepID=UPI001CD2F64F|nr:rod shape-determining protein [Cesiribacter sp. SM1]